MNSFFHFIPMAIYFFVSTFMNTFSWSTVFLNRLTLFLKFSLMYFVQLTLFECLHNFLTLSQTMQALKKIKNVCIYYQLCECKHHIILNNKEKHAWRSSTHNFTILQYFFANYSYTNLLQEFQSKNSYTVYTT